MPETETPVGKYIYCVIHCQEPRNFATRGIGERGDLVHTVNQADLGAVVSNSPIVEYESSRRNMMAHTVVLEEVMRDFAILPVRFGTVAPDSQAIQDKLLKRRHDELKGLLEEVDGRVELGLKAFWYEEIVYREIVEENPPIRELRDSISDRSPDQSYYKRIRLGEMVKTAMGRKRDSDAAGILAALHPLAYKGKVNSTLSDRMVLNAAFLVDSSREPEFDQAIHRLDADMGQREMFKYVGPVAPYNFVNVVVNWDE